jgi:hypothetical protein
MKHKTNFSFQDVFPDADFSCNREDDVFQYFQQLFSEKDAEVFEQHLKVCPLCASRLADLHEAAAAGESTVIDARKADQIFQQNLVKLQRHLGGKAEEPTKIYSVPSTTTFRIPAYVNVILIGLVGALIYPSYKSFVLDKEVSSLKEELKQERSKKTESPESNIAEIKRDYEKQIQSLNEERDKLVQPDLSGSAVYSVRSERGGDTQTIPVRFSDKQKAFTLVFSVQNTDFKTYVVEILQNGNIFWQDEMSLLDQTTAEGSLISVILKSDSLPEGNYKLKISGKGTAEPIKLNEYRLTVTK